LTTDDVDLSDAVIKMIQGSTSMYASGYTRFLEPVNLTAAMVKGEAYIAPDRQQGSAWVNKSVRYADELLESMALYVKPGEKYSAISPERAQVPIK
jgi:leucyl aminopeptidase (aminopeptidase T)